MRCAAAISNLGSFNPDQEQKTPVPELDEAGRAAHRHFMAYVRDLILGEREPSQFEDDVRALLGESPGALNMLLCRGWQACRAPDAASAGRTSSLTGFVQGLPLG